MADAEDMTAILRGLSEEKFAEIFAASSRQARETYFHRHGIKAPKKSMKMLRAGQKNEIRTRSLFSVLREREDEEMAEEVLRSWLLTRRELLVAALDHLDIEHFDGLTDSEDVERFEKLNLKELKELVGILKEVAPIDEVEIYLRYMGSKNVGKAL